MHFNVQVSTLVPEMSLWPKLGDMVWVCQLVYNNKTHANKRMGKPVVLSLTHKTDKHLPYINYVLKITFYVNLIDDC